MLQSWLGIHTQPLPRHSSECYLWRGNSDVMFIVLRHSPLLTRLLPARSTCSGVARQGQPALPRLRGGRNLPHCGSYTPRHHFQETAFHVCAPFGTKNYFLSSSLTLAEDGPQPDWGKPRAKPGEAIYFRNKPQGEENFLGQGAFCVRYCIHVDST